MTARALTEPTADGLLRAAHRSAYRFPDGFGGFRARLRLPGGQVGTLLVRSAESVDVTAGAAPDGEVAWARGELASIVGHRWSSGYDAGDGRWAKELDQDDGHPLGHRVRLLGDPYHSAYRVEPGGHIAQVDRETGRVRFTIVIDERTVTADGRTLPARFHVAFWSTSDGRLSQVDTHRHRYVEVGGVYLPQAVRVSTVDDAGLEVRELTLSEHEVLADA